MMMDGTFGMAGWGMALIALLVVVLAVLGIAALVKYLFSSGNK
jgi:4-amino-4-deoxy-L-arabinose transferase-like glycosyltransferase